MRRRPLAALVALGLAFMLAGPLAAQQPQPQRPQGQQQRAPAAPAAPAAGEIDYVTRGTGPACPRAPCTWDVRNAATRERVVVGRIDIAALRLPQARASDFMLDLAEGRFVVRGTVVPGQPQPALRITRIVRVAPAPSRPARASPARRSAADRSAKRPTGKTSRTPRRRSLGGLGALAVSGVRPVSIR